MITEEKINKAIEESKVYSDDAGFNIVDETFLADKLMKLINKEKLMCVSTVKKIISMLESEADITLHNEIRTGSSGYTQKQEAKIKKFCEELPKYLKSRTIKL